MEMKYKNDAIGRHQVLFFQFPIISPPLRPDRIQCKEMFYAANSLDKIKNQEN